MRFSTPLKIETIHIDGSDLSWYLQSRNSHLMWYSTAYAPSFLHPGRGLWQLRTRHKPRREGRSRAHTRMYCSTSPCVLNEQRLRQVGGTPCVLLTSFPKQTPSPSSSISISRACQWTPAPTQDWSMNPGSEHWESGFGGWGGRATAKISTSISYFLIVYYSPGQRINQNLASKKTQIRSTSLWNVCWHLHMCL